MTIQRNVDMCNGRLLPNILKYSLPLMLTGLLQLLYNAADIIVVAKWAGGTALAAVGSNSALINLILNALPTVALRYNTPMLLGMLKRMRRKQIWH